MKTKHTPGPWQYNERTVSKQISNHALSIADCYGKNEEAQANAKLIAAAPDLLEEHKDWSKLLGHIVVEALQGKYDCLKEVMTELTIIYIDCVPHIESAAIKKATE